MSISLIAKGAINSAPSDATLNHTHYDTFLHLAHARPHAHNLLGLEDTAVPHLAIPQSVHGIGDTGLGHGELHDDGLDAVQSGELEHVAVDGAGGDDGALDGEAVEIGRASCRERV